MPNIQTEKDSKVKKKNKELQKRKKGEKKGQMGCVMFIIGSLVRILDLNVPPVPESRKSRILKSLALA